MSGTSQYGSSDGVFALDHIDSLYAYAMVLTRNRTEAEDLVQETYARALEAAGRLRENSNVKGWLFTILRNLWFNELRKRRRILMVDDPNDEVRVIDTLADDRRNAHDILVSQEHSEAVHAALKHLPTEFREVILLREFQELSYQEIAEVLGCPAGTVMSRLGRARAKLRTLLAVTWGRRVMQGVNHERML